MSSGLLSSSEECIQDEQKEEDKETQIKEDEELSETLLAAVAQCVQQGLMTVQRAQTYYQSALDADLQFALQNRPAGDIFRRCLVYVHKIVNWRGQKTVDPIRTPHEESLMLQLREHFLPSLVSSCQLLVYTTTSKCDLRHGYTPLRRRNFVEGLCQQLHTDLVNLIDSSVAVDTVDSPEAAESHVENALARVQAEQEELCRIYAGLYEMRRPEEEVLRAYVEQLKDRERPLVLIGGPCTGKTVTLTHCAKQIHLWLADRDPVVIIRFPDPSVTSSPKLLLSSLCHQIIHSYRLRTDPHLNIDRNLNTDLDSRETCNLPTLKHHKHTVASSLDPCVSGGHVCVELGPVERRMCVRMLASLLEVSGRRVTSGQQAGVNQALSSGALPLYTRLLHAHAVLWSSGSEVTASSLPSGIHSSISALLDHLEKRHGSSLVSRALSYLSLSKVGLTQAELSDLLSSDNDVLAGYTWLDKGPPCRMRLPELDVGALLLDLKGFLGKRTVAGTQVLFWISRHFELVVGKRYLSSREARREVHSAMADYFSGRWAYGRAKPLTIAQNSIGPNNTKAAPTTAQKKIYVDRQPPGQPYVFNFTDKSPSSSGNVNFRKLIELPYHLRESMRWEELVPGLMMSLEFHQAMLHAGLHRDLVALLEGEGSPGLTLPRERAVLASILLASACVLRSSPTELPMVMEVRLLPCLGAYPELEGYAKEVRKERRRRGCGLGVLLYPAPSTVPSTKCTLGGARDCTITGVVCTESGVVVATMRDGSAWIWKGPGRGMESEELTLNLRERDKCTFIQVKSSGRCILLSTQCNMLVLWDVSNKPGPDSHLPQTNGIGSDICDSL
ncbi:NACHT and WD repeat domain-containing protein 2-like [Aplochiton taeniatus]